MNGSQEIYEVLKNLEIQFEYHEHPPAPTIEIAKEYWKDLDATHCKNIFLRNHKGNKHYLVVFEHNQNLSVNWLEQKLKQGKLSFASDWRLEQYLKVKAGSVSPLALVHDTENHIHVFLDEMLSQAKSVSFHPGINTASLVLSLTDFERYMKFIGNSYEYLKLY